MPTPIISLLMAGFALMLILYLFWPESGVFWQWKRGLTDTERVLIEDALKDLYEQEYKGQPSTVKSLSKSLDISGEEAGNLMIRLDSLGLLKTQIDRFVLTSMGRSYALRMIRAHRLWERYLADKTGVDKTQWHARAEELEHNMTSTEVRALAAEVGHPIYDPDGDPIPTADGELPPPAGIEFNDLAEGDLARITHIEDEPAAVYAQLVAANLHPGMQIRLLEKSVRRLIFIADGGEVVLAPIVAANITVVPLPKEKKLEGPYDSLITLAVGEKGEVTGISNACLGQQRRRIMDLGVIPGTVITMERHSASGNPVAYNIRGATIALRDSEAKLIYIKSIKEAA